MRARNASTNSARVYRSVATRRNGIRPSSGSPARRFVITAPNSSESACRGVSRPLASRARADTYHVVSTGIGAISALRGAPPQAPSAQREEGARDENLVSSDEAGEGRWSLRPTVAGRLVAISGRAFACAQEVVLEDVRTGRVLWRTRPFAPGSGGTADQRSEVIRPGVSVEADRTYELRATYATSSDDCGKGAPLAMLFPQ